MDRSKGNIQMPRLLVVEDRVEICEVVDIFLKEQGHSVTIANHGKAALSLLESERFDAVIVDVLLPGVPGLDLAKFADLRGTAVIMISGDPNSIEKLNEEGAYPFLQKPFHLAELEAAVRAVLKGRQADGHAGQPQLGETA
jgi:DNA-binding response OmpR family regulator